MRALKGKLIVVGITGGIAAYKAAGVVSKLHQTGADVHVMMTEAAQRFMTPLTFQTLSHNRVLTDLWSEPLAHVELARSADLFVIMPATLNTIAKVANGIADNLLTTAVSATRAPVLLCPAMDSNMYHNQVFQQNKRKLEGLGYRFLEPEEGRLASGRTGIGRFPAEERILEAIREVLEESSLLKGLKVLVTAGPTREMIDPMRCITNRSSGKMGYALAERARELGAAVSLISGPTQLAPPLDVNVTRLESAEEMREAVLRRADDYDVVIMAAAVADWRPKTVSKQKLKKVERDELELILEKTADIAKELGERKREGQILVGFAAETKDLIKNAEKKLREKNLDMIVVNDISRRDIGPESDINAVTLLYRDGRSEELPKMEKKALAREILKRLAEQLNAS